MRSSRLSGPHRQACLFLAAFASPIFLYTCFTYSVFLWPFLLACRPLVPHQGWNPVPSSESAESWTTRKFLLLFLKN